MRSAGPDAGETPSAGRRGRRALLWIGLAALVLLVLGLLAVWTLRFRIATAFVDSRLAKTGVPVSYRLTRIDPFLERIEDVRIGDPAAPDLTAKRVEVRLGYGERGPEVREVRAEGVRLRGSVGPGGLSLGALDRLLPRSGGGGALLPDLAVTLRDVHLALATPNGAFTLVLEGSGNPQRRFTGHARVAAPAARLATCAIRGISADLALEAVRGRPHVRGPLSVTSTVCPDVALGRGTAALDLRTDARFQALAARATLAGFGGEVGPVRLSALAGPVQAAGRFGALNVQARLGLTGLSAPTLSRRVAATRDLLAGTPLGPTVARASGAAARLLTQADATVDMVATVRGKEIDAGVRRAALVGRDGAFVRVADRGGTGWTACGWRTDVTLEAGGGGLPPLTLMLRQPSLGGPLDGSGRLDSYAAGAARLAATGLRFRRDAQGLSFATTLTVDGPVATGFVRGLVLPIRGAVDARGRFAVGDGCAPLAIASFNIGAFAFGPARTTLCGQPLVGNARGKVAIGATTGPVTLMGRIGGTTPVEVRTAGLRVRDKAIAAATVTATIGGGPAPTRIAADRLDARIGDVVAGSFAGASATIGSVPVGIAEAAGQWSLRQGTLALSGIMQARDLASSPRFRPLIAEDASLRLANDVIVATATMRAPARREEVMHVAIEHDLATGGGRALLDVPGIRFRPKGLQPDMLTPLTLGVVANVSGVVAGQGRIDWTGEGVTSSGTFGTERLDLAAAFGPVSGIAGRVRFTNLLGLVSAPDQVATVAEINPGVAIADGVIRYGLPGDNRVKVESARWPFAGGTLRLEPTMLDFGADAERRLTFRIEGLDAAAFVQQLDFPNLAATGTFDGVLPMAFGQSGGRVTQGVLEARKPGGTLAYVGEISNARLGTIGKLAFDALKAIRYSTLDIRLDGALDGEMVSRVRFTGVREATAEHNLVARLIRNLPFRFNIAIRAPFRGLVGSARSYADPSLLLQGTALPAAAADVQPAASEPVR